MFFFSPKTDVNICATHKVQSNSLQLTAIALDAFLIDGLIKLIVMMTLPIGSTVSLIPFGLALWHTENKGIAFSAGSALPMWMISLLTGLLLVGMSIYIYKRVSLKCPLQMVSLALLLAGGWNNWLDRTLTGAVTDYIAIAQFPVFNCSDVFITLGCVLLVLYNLFPQRFEGTKKQVESDTATVAYLDHQAQTVLCATDVAKRVNKNAVQ
jgi:signal peptidase II